MDQIKTGKFIASCRKEQNMTQAVLAEKLGISDRAVSKWDRNGRSNCYCRTNYVCGLFQKELRNQAEINDANKGS